MKIKLLLFIVVSFIKLQAQTQEFLTTDVLGATYTITNQQVSKDYLGKTHTYKNILLGKIATLDVVNPLQTLIFYKQQNSIVLLDRFLTETHLINLQNKAPDLQITYAGTANQNQIWMFDIISNRFVLYNILNDSYKFLTHTIDDEITNFKSNLNYLYFKTVNDKEFEIDIYGKLKPSTSTTN
nr:hypothetical protein [uncultured Flavobacterium sp.]